MPGLTIRKLADRSRGERLEWRDRDGVKHLINPETGKREPWPLLGVMLDEKPEHCRVPTSTISRGASEGWIVLENERIVTAAGGPPRNPHAIVHTFRQCDAIVFRTVEGDVRYQVLHNPGKYADGNATRVDWFYDLELVTG